MKAQIWGTQGRLDEALGWARAQNLSVDDDLRYLREFEHITLARVLITQHLRDRKIGSSQEAIGLLKRLLHAAEESGRMGVVIEILVLQTLAHNVQVDIPGALVSLECTLELAEPESYLRIFVDEGLQKALLLFEALWHGFELNYVQRLLAEFPTDDPKNVDLTKS